MSHTQRLVCLAVLSLAACAATDTTSGPAAGSFELQMEREVDGQRYHYLLEVPGAAERPDDGWPLLVFLHGAGERGEDLSRVGIHGPVGLVGEVPELGACLLAAPQCPGGGWWQTGALTALVDELLTRPDVDPDRVYLTGLSMGGYGTWNLLAASPERFAAGAASR